MCDCLCQRSYFFGTILYELNPWRNFWIASENFHLLKDGENLHSVFSAILNNWMTRRPAGKTQRYLFSLSTHSQGLFGWEAFHIDRIIVLKSLLLRQSKATLWIPTALFCSDVCNPGLLGFCPSTELRTIKAMWVTRTVPSTGVVITSNVITIIPACNHKKPQQKSPDALAGGSGWLVHTPWWVYY